jgi:hypothetical protein
MLQRNKNGRGILLATGLEKTVDYEEYAYR